MIKLPCSLYALAALLLPMQPLFAQDTTHADAAVSEAVQASGHASASAAHSIAATGQVTFAASAAPLASGGAALMSAGATGVAVASDLLQAATAPIGAPLPLTDEVLVITPPNEALRAPAKPAQK